MNIQSLRPFCFCRCCWRSWMEQCRVCWTPPLSHRRNSLLNPPAPVPTPGSARAWAPEAFATPTESPPPPRRDTPTTGRSRHTFTPLSSCVFSENRKRGWPLFSLVLKDCVIFWCLICFLLFSFRPSASTLIGHPFFKQVCKIHNSCWFYQYVIL